MIKFPVSLAWMMLFAVLVLGSQDQPELKMPCPEVVKLGLDKFMNVYGEKTNDFSTVGMKQGFGYYVGCKRWANNERASKPANQRHTRHVGRHWFCELGQRVHRGGRWNDVRSCARQCLRGARRSDGVCDCGHGHAGRWTSRRRANLALRRARRALPGVTQAVELEHWDESSRAEQLKRYRENVNAIRNGFTKLE